MVTHRSHKPEIARSIRVPASNSITGDIWTQKAERESQAEAKMPGEPLANLSASITQITLMI